MFRAFLLHGRAKMLHIRINREALLLLSDVIDAGQGTVGEAIEELHTFAFGVRILGTYPAR